MTDGGTPTTGSDEVIVLDNVRKQFGSFVALDLLLFFLFFEAILVPMYFLIGGWGSARRGYAAIKFFLYTMAGSAFLLLATVFLWSMSASLEAGATFDLDTHSLVVLREHSEPVASPDHSVAASLAARSGTDVS